jgi:hypothetical protein
LQVVVVVGRTTQMTKAEQVVVREVSELALLYLLLLELNIQLRLVLAAMAVLLDQIKVHQVQIRL